MKVLELLPEREDETIERIHASLDETAPATKLDNTGERLRKKVNQTTRDKIARLLAKLGFK